MIASNQLAKAGSAEKASPQSQLAKWGLAGRAGFQVVPNVLFRAQKHLDLDTVDVVLLLNLSLHWWGASDLPFPSPALVAERMNVSRRTVERRLLSLEKRGFIKRLRPRSAGPGKPKVRRVEMEGLVEKLEGAALIGLARRDFATAKRSSALRLSSPGSSADRAPQAAKARPPATEAT